MKEPKIPKVDRPLMLELYKQGAKSQSELAKMFDVTRGMIYQIIRNELSPRERKEAEQLRKAILLKAKRKAYQDYLNS